jgi:hypothetical protein
MNTPGDGEGKGATIFALFVPFWAPFDDDAVVSMATDEDIAA